MGQDRVPYLGDAFSNVLAEIRRNSLWPAGVQPDNDMVFADLRGGGGGVLVGDNVRSALNASEA